MVKKTSKTTHAIRKVFRAEKTVMLQREMEKKNYRQGVERGNKNTEPTLTKTPYVWHA